MVIKNRLAGEPDQRTLATDLSGDFVVGQSVGRKDGNLLPTSDGIHDVNGRDASLDHFLRIDAGVRVDGLTLDLKNNLELENKAT